MDSETIANKARGSIGNFCFDECKAYCCRKGFLILNKKQAELIVKDMDSKKLTRMSNNQYSLDLSPCCPALKDFKCSIHKNKSRPKVCHVFPLFIEGRKISPSGRCLAVRKNMLFPHIKKLISMGYKLN